MRPLLLIVSGAPASGKTTLSRRLEKDLHVPLLAKDDIKELLFNRLEQSDRDWSTVQGRMAIEMMYSGATVLLTEGVSVMIESSFKNEFARRDIEDIQTKTNARIYELHCYLSQNERQRRWTVRSRTDRHPGHLDNSEHVISIVEEPYPLYPHASTIIYMDTTEGAYEIMYHKVLNQLEALMLEGAKS